MCVCVSACVPSARFYVIANFPLSLSSAAANCIRRIQLFEREKLKETLALQVIRQRHDVYVRLGEGEDYTDKIDEFNLKLVKIVQGINENLEEIRACEMD